ncbi:MAG: metallophosphoesterase family protein [Deltaproteobacteria bacterium]|nr:metallophosphoesterase family protein [Deltaproteobacteria bacterium]
MLLSDAHVDGPADPVQARLVAFLEDVRADRLVLLGDVFHRWWEIRGRPFPAYEPVIAALAVVVARGVAVHVVMGNHDFAAAPKLEALPGLWRTGPVTVDLDGRRVYLAHGDAVDPGAGVRWLGRVIRSATFDRLLQGAGPAAAWRLLGALAGPAGRDRAPPPSLLAAQRSFAEARIREGADLVVMGHLHRPCVEALGGGTLANPGTFRHADSHLVLEDGVPHLVRE